MITSRRSASQEVALWRMRVDFVVDGGILFDDRCPWRECRLRADSSRNRTQNSPRRCWEKTPGIPTASCAASVLLWAMHQSRAVEFLDDVGHGEGFAGTGYAQQHLIVHPRAGCLRSAFQWPGADLPWAGIWNAIRTSASLLQRNFLHYNTLHFNCIQHGGYLN